jgi:hypothetical protein
LEKPKQSGPKSIGSVHYQDSGVSTTAQLSATPPTYENQEQSPAGCLLFCSLSNLVNEANFFFPFAFDGCLLEFRMRHHVPCGRFR